MTRGAARAALMVRARSLGVEDARAGRVDRLADVNVYTFADRLSLRVGIPAERASAFDLAGAYAAGYRGETLR